MKVLNIGLNNDVSYLKYYEQLKTEFTDPSTCQKTIEKTYYDMCKRKMQIEFEKDEDSKLGACYQVSPLLLKYVPNPQPIMEIERELITRYRTGSHSLAIELGRSNTIRENRTCICGNFVQSLSHAFNECTLTREIVQQNYANLSDIFADEEIHSKLIKQSLSR